MIAWFARNHVAANLLMAAILFLGLMSLFKKIPLEVFPTFEADEITVNVSLPGATPEQVEESVAVRIEEAIQDLGGLSEIVSRSGEGGTSVNIEVDPDYDPREILAEIKSRVDAINTFPADAEKPVISLAQRRREVISVAIAGDYTEGEIRLLAEQVRDDLLRIPGITQVEMDAVRNYEIAIEVSEAILQQYRLTLAEIAQAVRRSSIDVSAGSIRTEGGEVLIRSKGQAYRHDQFDDIVVLMQRDGSVLRLKDIATVIDGFEETPVRTRFNGKLAAFVDVYSVGQQSALKVAAKVKNYIAEKKDAMPVGVELSYWRDRSKIVEKRLKTLTDNAIQGGILVIALLTLFLRPMIAFWVFIGVPVSFMGAFIFMPMFDVTLNIFSLFGFILVLGIVVDDAIVTGENIYTHLRRAENGLQAAIEGTREVAIPVTFGILTTIAAFIPLAFIEGDRGKLFAQIPLVVIPIFIFSLLESKLILPAHLKHIRLRQNHAGIGKLEQWQQRFADGFEHSIIRYYRPALHWTLRNRYLFLSLLAGILMLVLALIYSGWTRFVYFPRVHSEVARVSLTMPSGTPYEVTSRYVDKIAQTAFALKDKYRDSVTNESLILDILSTSGSADNGSGGSHVGRVMFEIVPPENRQLRINSSEIVEEWRKLIGPIPGAESLIFRAEIGRVSDPIDIQLTGHDFAVLADVANSIMLKLTSYPGVFDISDSLSDGKEELQIELKDEAYALGLTREEVLSQVRQAFYGFQAQRIQRGRDDVRVMVRYAKISRESVATLQNMWIATSDDRRIPLGQIAELKPGKSPTAIYRIDRYRTVNVRADIDKQSINMLVLQQDLEMFLNDLMNQYPGIKYSFEGEAKEQQQSFGSLSWGFIFVLFIIYSLLAIPFKSYFQPLIVMSVIPFGIVGAVMGHWIMMMDLTMMSLLGMMALIGVMVNDSLVLVDFINKHRQDTESIMKAVLNAGVARFRPIILTSLTTFVGLMPLLFEKSTQAQFLIPMAVSLGFGILFATVLTLLFVPINYIVAEDIKAWWGRRGTALLTVFWPGYQNK